MHRRSKIWSYKNIEYSGVEFWLWRSSVAMSRLLWQSLWFWFCFYRTSYIVLFLLLLVVLPKTIIIVDYPGIRKRESQDAFAWFRIVLLVVVFVEQARTSAGIVQWLCCAATYWWGVRRTVLVVVVSIQFFISQQLIFYRSKRENKSIQEIQLKKKEDESTRAVDNSSTTRAAPFQKRDIRQISDGTDSELRSYRWRPSWCTTGRSTIEHWLGLFGNGKHIHWWLWG